MVKLFNGLYTSVIEHTGKKKEDRYVILDIYILCYLNSLKAGLIF